MPCILIEMVKTGLSVVFFLMLNTRAAIAQEYVVESPNPGRESAVGSSCIVKDGFGNISLLMTNHQIEGDVLILKFGNQELPLKKSNGRHNPINEAVIFPLPNTFEFRSVARPLLDEPDENIRQFVLKDSPPLGSAFDHPLQGLALKARGFVRGKQFQEMKGKVDSLLIDEMGPLVAMELESKIADPSGVSGGPVVNSAGEIVGVISKALPNGFSPTGKAVSYLFFAPVYGPRIKSKTVSLEGTKYKISLQATRRYWNINKEKLFSKETSIYRELLDPYFDESPIAGASRDSRFAEWIDQFINEDPKRCTELLKNLKALELEAFNLESGSREKLKLRLKKKSDVESPVELAALSMALGIKRASLILKDTVVKSCPGEISEVLSSGSVH